MKISKEKVVSVGLGTLVGTIIGLGIYYLTGQPQTSQDTSSQTSDSSKVEISEKDLEASVDGDIGSSRVYRSEEYGFALQHPAEWKIEENFDGENSLKFSGESGWITVNLESRPIDISKSTPPSVGELNLNVGGIEVKATEVRNKDETGYIVAQLEQGGFHYDLRFGNTDTKYPHYDRDKENLLKIIESFEFI